MKIRDILSAGKRSLSFEFFPPKTEQGVESLFRAVDQLTAFQPDFVSVTYGAGGNTRDTTVRVVSRIGAETELLPLCHVTCVAQTKEEIHNVLVQLENERIDNVLALRGDPPQGEDRFVPPEGGFDYSSDLVAHVRENFDFGIAGACFPEGHPDSPDLETDIVHLKRKVDAGTDFLITQLFFDNADFFSFMERVERMGIQVPIIAGILPILSAPQIRRFTALCGARIPDALDAKLEKYAEDDEAVQQIGIEHASRQVEELWRNGVAGIHFYCLNKSHSVSRILENCMSSRV